MVLPGLAQLLHGPAGGGAGSGSRPGRGANPADEVLGAAAAAAAHAHSLTWEEAQIAAGVDPDFHRRDLADAIEAGAFPEWELGVQIFPDNEEQAVPTGEAPYLPNSVDGGSPQPSSWEDGGYVDVPRHVEGDVVRAAASSFDDHFSQPAMFYASLSDVEKTHTVEAYTSELGKCYDKAIKERALTVLARIDTALCEKVAAGLGLPVPDEKPVEHLAPSPALAQVKDASFPISGRQVGVVAGPDADGAPDDGDIKSVILLQEAYRQLKPFAAWGTGGDVLAGAGIDLDAPGVLTRKTAKGLVADLVAAMGRHRVWERADLVTASQVPPAAG